MTPPAPRSPIVETMAERRVRWTDLGLTALLVVFAVFGTGPAAANQSLTASKLSYVLAVIAALPIAIWRWRPILTFGLTGATTILYIGLGYAYGPIQIALALASYGLALRSPIRRSVIATAAAYVATGVAIGVGMAGGTREWSEFVSTAAWLVLPAAIGVAVKVRRDARVDLRAEQARRTISEERLRLAQEVHDVVGHGLAVVALQAGVALRVLDRDPAGARVALEAIRTTSKDALDDLRAEIEDLRGDAAVPLRPQLGLADLPALAERLRSGGLAVALEVDDRSPALPAEVNLAAYRIVRESLSNVLRHGGPGAAANVHIVRTAGTLDVEVLDTGIGGVPGTGGHGIDGMRSRALALGGTLDAGPAPGGGFAVRARLPVRPAQVSS